MRILPISRGNLHKEIKEALDIADRQPEGTIFIIPVKLEKCTVPERLNMWQWVELYEEGGFKKLIKALEYRTTKLSGSSSKLVFVEKKMGPKGTIKLESIPIEGRYIANGKNNDGTLYKGKVSIKKDKDWHIIKWQIGKTTYTSRGVVNGDILNVFGDFKVSYIIGEDGCLNGIWGESATEKLIPEKYFKNDF